jgi:uncharacterized membrane protein YhaH (DUF805 family)
MTARGPVAAVRAGFANYATFSGRSARAPTLWFMLVFSLGNYVLVNGTRPVAGDGGALALVIGGLSWLFFLSTVTPMAAFVARRLHDTGRSGLWAVLPVGAVVAISVFERLWVTRGYGPMIPIFAVSAPIMLWFAVWLLAPGSPGANRFGPPPA